MDVDQLIHVLQITVNSFTYPSDPLAFLNARPAQILDFKDFAKLSMVCHALREYVRNMKFMCYSVTKLDFRVDCSVRKHGDIFLYYVERQSMVHRFLQIFGYTYGELHLYDTRNYGTSAGYGITPLHISCKRGMLYTVEAILKYDPRALDCMDGDGVAPLYYALTYCHRRIFTHIITNYPEYVNKPCLSDGSTPLLVACRCIHTSYVKILVELGANPNISVYGPLIFVALQSGTVLKELLKSKIPIDLTVTDRNGESVYEYINFQKQFGGPDDMFVAHWEYVDKLVHEYAALGKN